MQVQIELHKISEPDSEDQAIQTYIDWKDPLPRRRDYLNIDNKIYKVINVMWRIETLLTIVHIQVTDPEEKVPYYVHGDM